MELLRTIGDANVLALAALLGEEGVIKEYLDEYPNDVSYSLFKINRKGRGNDCISFLCNTTSEYKNIL